MREACRLGREVLDEAHKVGVCCYVRARRDVWRQTDRQRRTVRQRDREPEPEVRDSKRMERIASGLFCERGGIRCGVCVLWKEEECRNDGFQFRITYCSLFFAFMLCDLCAAIFFGDVGLLFASHTLASVSLSALTYARKPSTQAARVGVTTDEIDRVVHDACMERKCYPSPLGYGFFPKSCCTSVNEVICHG